MVFISTWQVSEAAFLASGVRKMAVYFSAPALVAFYGRRELRLLIG